MNKENIEDITFKLLANQVDLRKKIKKNFNEDDELFLKIKKDPGMVVFKSDKN